MDYDKEIGSPEAELEDGRSLVPESLCAGKRLTHQVGIYQKLTSLDKPLNLWGF